MAIDPGWYAALVAAGLLVVPVPVSYLVEALRRAPSAPERLSWAPDVPLRHVEVDGVRLRYIATGEGPPLVLLHTLRTQLDLFQKVVPRLSRHFRVYALDYPGHGFSDIPDADYSAAFFVASVAGFLEKLGIDDAVVAGESIGGTIALVLAARRTPRVRRVVAVNPYDYDRGRGLRRSSALANVFFGLNNVPVLGATVARLRQYPVVKKVFEGGVSRADALPPALVREMYAVGNRRGHTRAFMSLVRHWPDWEAARREYGRIQVPVLLLYGEDDWSRPDEREANLKAIPGAKMAVVPNARHFLSLDAPDEVVRAIRDFAAGDRGATGLRGG